MHVDLQAVEREAQHAWNTRPDLRAEFGDQLDAWLAFKRGEACGAIRIHSGARGVVIGSDVRHMTLTLDCPMAFAGGDGRVTVALAGTNRGRVAGLAAAYGGRANRKGVVLEAGSFARARAPVPMLWAHDGARPIGHWDVVREDDAGLHVSGSLNLAVPDGQQAFHLLQGGDVVGLSVGFGAAPGDYTMEKGAMTIRRADLYEISLCPVPAEPRAHATAVEG